MNPKYPQIRAEEAMSELSLVDYELQRIRKLLDGPRLAPSRPRTSTEKPVPAGGVS